MTETLALTFDNSFDHLDDTTGITVSNLNITLGSAPAFTYSHVTDGLAVGGSAFGAFGISSFTDDLLAFSTYAVAGNNNIFSTPHLTVTPHADASPVPEPASLTLLGLGLIGAATRRLRRR